ncbi:MAG: cytochrome b/b6 domain-containing protein [Halocynthiibacter sp.]
MPKRLVKVYPRFERIWHWCQALLIVVLVITGFGLNGVHALLPFGPAVMLHTIAALILLCLWIFATFWLFTTGTWKQFVPTLDGLIEVARFYSIGIFKGEKHPHKKLYWRKHNPLQILAYFGLKMFVFPAIWVTGILYLTYNFWDAGEGSQFWIVLIANLHVLAAYVVVSFVIIHLYLLTVGHGFRHHVKPMISGYEEVELTEEQDAYLMANEPERILK